MANEQKNKNGKVATTTSEARQLLKNIQPGDTFRIKGYVDGDGVVYDLTLKQLASDGRRELLENSRRILAGISVPAVSKSDPEVADKALSELRSSVDKAIASYTEGATGVRESDTPDMPWQQAAAPNEFYVLRMEELERTVVAGDKAPKKQRPLTIAKREIEETYRLPHSRYVHRIKLADGKFTQVEIL